MAQRVHKSYITLLSSPLTASILTLLLVTIQWFVPLHLPLWLLWPLELEFFWSKWSRNLVFLETPYLSTDYSVCKLAPAGKVFLFILKSLWCLVPVFSTRVLYFWIIMVWKLKHSTCRLSSLFKVVSSVLEMLRCILGKIQLKYKFKLSFPAMDLCIEG